MTAELQEYLSWVAFIGSCFLSVFASVAGVVLRETNPQAGQRVYIAAVYFVLFAIFLKM